MAKKKNAEKPHNGASAKEHPETPEITESTTAAGAEAAAETKSADAAEAAEAATPESTPAGEETAPDSAKDAEPSAEEKIKEYEEKYLRAEAQAQNNRRRFEKQITEVHQLALKSFVPALGDVYDCLEKSLEIDAGDEKMREGVALTLRKLKSMMDLHHISPIRPDIGAMFDPAMHMAIGVSPPTETAPADTIAVVVQPGYMVDGRIVRAADVMVSQVPPEKTE